jgi:hypothetical protein
VIIPSDAKYEMILESWRYGSSRGGQPRKHIQTQAPQNKEVVEVHTKW